MSLIIETGFKVSVIVLIALVTCALFRSRSAALRHWVLGAAIACATATPVLSVALPPWLSAPLWNVNRVQQPREAANAAEASPRGDASMSAASVEVEFVVAAQPDASSVRLGARELLIGLWAVGGLFSALVLIVGLGRLHWLAAHAQPIVGGPWFEQAEAIRRAYAISHPIRLLVSDHSSLLVTWGLRRPKVLLPASAREWPPDRLRVVLAHELAHVKRGDWVMQMTAEVLRSAYWFNPILWIACRRLRIESERACDDAVLGQGVEGPAFATHLLALARSLNAERQAWLPAPAMAHPSSLEGRIRAMLNTTLNRRPVSGSARIASLVALMALTVPIAGIRAQSFYSFTGTVLDPSNRVLPETQVILLNATSKAKYEVQTDLTGRFEFVGLPRAQYVLEARKPGFAVIKEDIQITGNIERDLRLRVGSLEETLTVTDQAVPAGPPDAAALQKREEMTRRFTEMAEREKARCEADTASSLVGGHILPPRKLVDARPVYPEQLKAAKLGGVVTVEAVIGPDGLVREVHDVKGPYPDLESAAVEAVRQWQYSPTLLNCEATDVTMTVTTNFKVVP